MSNPPAPMTEPRVLPQHFNRDGSIKRKYPTLAEAIYAAGNLPNNDPDRDSGPTSSRTWKRCAGRSHLWATAASRTTSSPTDM